MCLLNEIPFQVNLVEDIFDGERMSEKKFVVVDGEGRREMKGNGPGCGLTM